MKKVKLKLSFTEACALLQILTDGQIVALSSDVRFSAMTEALICEVIDKLSLATRWRYHDNKTFSFSVAQATAITLVQNPYKESPYFEYHIRYKITDKILSQFAFQELAAPL